MPGMVTMVCQRCRRRAERLTVTSQHHAHAHTHCTVLYARTHLARTCMYSYTVLAQRLAPSRAHPGPANSRRAQTRPEIQNPIALACADVICKVTDSDRDSDRQKQKQMSSFRRHIHGMQRVSIIQVPGIRRGNYSFLKS